jgi:UDP-N-acetylglucosamine 1-carboxyvinyltransferase
MAASLLAPGRNTLSNVPDIADVGIMSELLERLGCTVVHDPAIHTLTIDVPEVPGHKADYDLVRKMRASINVLGPLIARVGQADVALPGGDAIGSRGLDFHIEGLRALAPKFTLNMDMFLQKLQQVLLAQLSNSNFQASAQPRTS